MAAQQWRMSCGKERSGSSPCHRSSLSFLIRVTGCSYCSTDLGAAPLVGHAVFARKSKFFCACGFIPNTLQQSLVVHHTYCFISFDVDFPVEVDDEYWSPSDSSPPFKQPKDKPSVVSGFVCMLKLTQIIAYALRTIVSHPQQIALFFIDVSILLATVLHRQVQSPSGSRQR